MSETHITVPATQTAAAIPPAIRYLKQAEDHSRARAANYRAAVLPMASVVVVVAVILQAFSFPAACFAILILPWAGCLLVYLLAKAAERHADSIHSATIDGLSDWIKE